MTLGELKKIVEAKATDETEIDWIDMNGDTACGDVNAYIDDGMLTVH